MERVEKFEDGPIEGVLVKALTQYEDARGWLCEVYRSDEAPQDTLAAMCYVSVTRPSVVRGPHEHRDQTDWFCFVGPSQFKLVLWDNRKTSPTYRRRMKLVVGEGNPASVIVPPGVVHGYQNVGQRDGWVVNLPNRLYKGQGRKNEVDEVRHELDATSIFKMDDVSSNSFV